MADIFDQLGTEEDVFETVEPVSRTRSLLGAFPKGALRETGQQIRKSLSVFPELLGLKDVLGDTLKTEEEAGQELEQILPTREGFLEEALQRGGAIAPYALLGGEAPISNLVRSLFAGVSGEAAKELGLPEWAQSLAELPAFAAPAFKGKITPTKAQKPIVEKARELGLSEKAIAPLIQPEKKQRFLSKVATKRGRAQKVLERSKEALGDVYNRLEALPISNEPLSKEASSKFISSVDGILDKLPSEIAKRLEADYTKLQSAPLTGNSIMDFYKKLNYYIPRGAPQFGLIKEPIQEGLQSISPKLASDFKSVTDLYAKYFPIAKNLKPGLISDLLSATKVGRLMFGIFSGNLSLLAETVGEKAAQDLSRELLINPRFQNLSKQMVKALNEGKYAVARSLSKIFKKEIEKTDPEIASEIDPDEFFNQIRQ